MIVADTSGLLALVNRREPQHAEVRRVVDAELAVLDELATGAYDLAQVGAGDLGTIASVVKRYRDQEVAVADASLVVLAARYRTRAILTLDRRHFSVLRPLDGGRFRLLPE